MTTSDNFAPLTPDALKHHWSLRYLPGWARPYGRLMRLERPAGWQLLFWPCAFSSLLASIALEARCNGLILDCFFSARSSCAGLVARSTTLLTETSTPRLAAPPIGQSRRVK
jgi:hypothetical protein